MTKKRTFIVKNENFGNRCTECGEHFEDGVCSNGHIQGDSYPITLKKSKKKKVK